MKLITIYNTNFKHGNKHTRTDTEALSLRRIQLIQQLFPTLHTFDYDF